MMTMKLQTEVFPGDVLNQTVIGIPRYEVITHLLDLERVKKWMRHAAIDWPRGYKAARRHVADANGEIKRLAAYLARFGCHLAVEPRRFVPFESLTLSVWILRGQRILAAIEWQHGGMIKIEERDGGDNVWRGGSARADVLVRRIQATVDAIEAKRAAARTESSEKYLSTLPEELRAIAQAARPECIRISPNGSVTETFHDCGGSMTRRISLTTEALRALQASHDEVYHPEGESHWIAI